MLHIPHYWENNRLDGSVIFPRESGWQTATPNQCTIGPLKHNVNSTSFPPFQGFREPFLLVIVMTTKQPFTSHLHDPGIGNCLKHTNPLFKTQHEPAGHRMVTIFQLVVWLRSTWEISSQDFTAENPRVVKSWFALTYSSNYRCSLIAIQFVL